MTITEWSRFTNATFEHRYPDSWAFAAGLRALGSGQRTLQIPDGGRFAEGSPPDPTGIPIVFVPAQDETACQALKDWLTINDALAVEARTED